jgi:ABC-type Fe3+/spermidine/putrescine transport system ATPase subunit
VTHDQAEALSLSDWIAVMKEGRVEQAGAPWESYYRPRTAFLADFVGAVNLIPATVRSTAGTDARVSFGSHELLVPAPLDAALSPGQEVRLCIRPETVEFAHDGTGSLVGGSIARRSFLGDRMRYWVTVDGKDWIVDQADPGAGQPLDGRVSLSLRPERVHVIA